MGCERRPCSSPATKANRAFQDVPASYLVNVLILHLTSRSHALDTCISHHRLLRESFQEDGASLEYLG